MFYIFGVLEGLITFTLSTIFNYGKNNFKCREHSTIHAISMSLFATLYLSDIVSINSWELMLGFSAGYALYEILLFPCYPQLKLDNPTIAHHLIMAYSTTYYQQYPSILAFFYLTEISTVFLNSSYIELKTNGKTKKFHICAVLTIMTFFIFRIIILWIMIWIMYYDNNCIGTIVGSLMGFINLFWFKKLIHSY